jgi:ribonuclease HII
MRYLVGIDEVGRGPIAGPVAVGAFIFLNDGAKKIFRGVKESKQLSEARREEWFAVIQGAKKRGSVDFFVSFQNEKVIDSKGISYAIRKALAKSLEWIMHAHEIRSSTARVLLDGGLRAPAHYKDQKTIIKGDEKEMVIALASICAKVLRDRKMTRLGERHPEYGFKEHKGYGTKRHYEAIEEYGMLAEHRRSFIL